MKMDMYMLGVTVAQVGMRIICMLGTILNWQKVRKSDVS